MLPQHPGISLPSPSDATSSNHLGHSIFPMLQSVLQTNILQRVSINPIWLTSLHSYSFENCYVVLWAGGCPKFNEATLLWWLYRCEHFIPLEFAFIYWNILVFIRSAIPAIDGISMNTNGMEKSLVRKVQIFYLPNITVCANCHFLKILFLWFVLYLLHNKVCNMLLKCK